MGRAGSTRIITLVFNMPPINRHDSSEVSVGVNRGDQGFRLVDDTVVCEWSLDVFALQELNRNQSIAL